MARRKSIPEEPGDSSQPTFEEALNGLEAIVEAMEHESLALESLVEHYEKGAAYLARCEEILRGARARIDLITLRNQNEIGLDADAISSDDDELTPPDDPDDDDNDIRLF